MHVRRVFLAVAIGIGSGCATHAPTAPQQEWSAHGYLTLGATDDPEIIGTYATRDDCEEAVADWMSRQVVGNPVSGECLPVDRR